MEDNKIVPVDEKVKVYNIEAIIQPDEDDVEVKKSYNFKKPSTVSFSRYMKTVSKNVMQASQDLLLDNVSTEHEEGLRKDIQEYPALVLSLSEKLLYSLGLAKEVNFKKL